MGLADGTAREKNYGPTAPGQTGPDKVIEITNLTDVLVTRGTRYGPFTGHAAITQQLKDTMRAFNPKKFDALAPDQKEALDMIAHKLGRILNGDPDYDDSWVDIAGYAQLVADRLNGVTR